MADKETIRPPQQIDFLPEVRQAGFRFLQQIAQWVNNALARLTTAESDIDTLQAATYVNFVDRGDPAAWDKTISDITADSTWKTGANALDLSAIIPSGAKAVLLKLGTKNDTSGSWFELRKAGNSNDISTGVMYCAVANVYAFGDVIVPAGTDRKFDYYATSGLDVMLLVVKGWWI